VAMSDEMAMSRLQPEMNDPRCVICQELRSAHVPTEDGPLTCPRLAHKEGRYVLVSPGYILSGAMGSPPFTDDIHVDPVYRFEPFETASTAEQ
jgi:hypothetical protein